MSMMVSFYQGDILDEILDLMSPFLRGFLSALSLATIAMAFKNAICISDSSIQCDCMS